MSQPKNVNQGQRVKGNPGESLAIFCGQLFRSARCGIALHETKRKDSVPKPRAEFQTGFESGTFVPYHVPIFTMYRLEN